MGRESGARRAKPRLVRICIGALCMCVYVCVGAHARARAYACGDLHAQVQYTAPSPAEFKAIVARIKADWGPLAVGPTEDGVSIWRRKVAGSNWDEIKGSAVLQCRPGAVEHLFSTSDAAVIRTFNPMYESGFDIQRFSAGAKAAYARVKAVFPGFAPRDTVSLVEQHAVPEDKGGGTVFLIRAMEHPMAPPDKQCVRAKIISGANLIQPLAGEPDKCLFTFTQHCDPGGAVPAWALNKVVSREGVQFLRRIEVCV